MVTVEEEGVVHGETREVVMRMLRTTANTWTLPSKRKTFKSVNEWWFGTYLTEGLESSND